jgi:hypothetical protein
MLTVDEHKVPQHTLRSSMDEGKYRSIFHSPMAPSDAFRAAHDEMRAWVRSKAYDLEAFDRGAARIGPGAMLLRSAANSADGSQTERWQLREIKDAGAWISSLTVHAPAEAEDNAATWFWVEIEFAPSNRDSERVYTLAGVPRLERGLLATIPAFDSLAELTDEPAVIGRERIDDLIDILCDPDRRLPVVIASAHSSMDFGEWKTNGRPGNAVSAGPGENLYARPPWNRGVH